MQREKEREPNIVIGMNDDLASSSSFSNFISNLKTEGHEKQRDLEESCLFHKQKP